MLIIWGKIPLHSGGHLGVLSENGGEIALQVLLAKLAQGPTVGFQYGVPSPLWPVTAL